MSRIHFLVGACASALVACFVPSTGDAEPQPAAGGEPPAAPGPAPAASLAPSAAIGPVPIDHAAPETSRIVFAAKIGDSLDLFSILPDGTGLVQLTNTPGVDEMFPRWSPDHTHIAYVADGALFVMDGYGTTRSIASGVGRKGYGVSAPAWSPDGASLLYPHARDADEGGATLLHRVAADGSSDVTFVADMTAVGATLSEPTWTSDAITFLRTSECSHCAGGASLVTVAPDGSNRSAVDLEAHGLDVAPDGRWAFTTLATATASGYEFPGTIYVTFAGGALSTAMTSKGAWMPRWSPTGAHLAYLRADGIYVTASTGGDGTRIFTKSGVRGIDW